MKTPCTSWFIQIRGQGAVKWTCKCQAEQTGTPQNRKLNKLRTPLNGNPNRRTGQSKPTTWYLTHNHQQILEEPSQRCQQMDSQFQIMLRQSPRILSTPASRATILPSVQSSKPSQAAMGSHPKSVQWGRQHSHPLPLHSP